MNTINGKIIRILDRRTVIINLGKNNGITEKSIFSIMGTPEKIIDPETLDVLGEVTIVKSRVKAKEVAEKFTIATTKWESVRINAFNRWTGMLAQNVEKIEQDEGELLVENSDIQPWKAKSESPVKIGDLVQVQLEPVKEEPVKQLPEKKFDSEEN